MHSFRSRATLVVVAAFALVGAACASDSSTSTPAASGGTDTGVCQSVDTTTGDALAEVCETGTLRVATDAKYKPQSWFDVQSEQWNGFDVDVANEIAKRLGVTTDIQAQKWAVITAGSWSDRWDLSVGSMTDTVDREELFYFSSAYYFTPAGVSVHNDNTTITDIATDLDGKKVCVGVETTYQDYINQTLVMGAGAPPFEFEVDDAQLQTFETDTDALDNLALGDGVRCDAAISATPTIQAFIDDGGPIKLVGDPIYYEPLAIALDRNASTDQTALAEAVDQIVLDMHDDGTLSTLSQKWYGADLTAST